MGELQDKEQGRAQGKGVARPKGKVQFPGVWRGSTDITGKSWHCSISGATPRQLRLKSCFL